MKTLYIPAVLAIGLAATASQVANPTPAIAAEGIIIEGRAVVMDGDTIRVGGTKVRLKGVDAAELGSRRGYEARAWMQAHIGFNATVTCDLTGERTYDREVGYCWQGERSLEGELGAAIIGAGKALACARYSTRYAAFEQPAAIEAQPRAGYCTRRAR